MNKERAEYDVIIIGGGPAGCTAGIYAARARMKAVLLESPSQPSQAMIADRIENYPGFPEGIGGFEIVDAFKKQAAVFGLESRDAKVDGISREGDSWSISAGDNRYSALSVIVATGGSPNKLGVPGEEQFRGRGVSYCATCDGALFKGKEVVVVGGGDTAAEESVFLTRFASRVTLIHRKSMLRAAAVLQEKARANGKIAFMMSSVVTEITGSQKVEGVKVREPQGDVLLPCSGVFIFIGYKPNTDFLNGVLKLDGNGRIITDGDMRTDLPGLFACGDCRQKLLDQVVTACGDGATAAFAAQKYVEALKGIEYK